MNNLILVELLNYEDVYVYKIYQEEIKIKLKCVFLPSEYGIELLCHIDDKDILKPILNNHKIKYKIKEADKDDLDFYNNSEYTDAELLSIYKSNPRSYKNFTKFEKEIIVDYSGEDID